MAFVEYAISDIRYKASAPVDLGTDHVVTKAKQ
jgi:hypothetical protein